VSRRSLFQRQCDAAYKRDGRASYALSAAIHDRADELLEGRLSNVYIIRDTETGAVKIGTAADPIARLGSLQSGNAHTLELVDWAPAGPLVERFFHEYLSAHRIRGEWFAPTAPVLIVCEFVMGAGDMRRDLRDLGGFGEIPSCGRRE
jgi:hypothetical protein